MNLLRLLATGALRLTAFDLTRRVEAPIAHIRDHRHIRRIQFRAEYERTPQQIERLSDAMDAGIVGLLPAEGR